MTETDIRFRTDIGKLHPIPQLIFETNETIRCDIYISYAFNTWNHKPFFTFLLAIIPNVDSSSVKRKGIRCLNYTYNSTIFALPSFYTHAIETNFDWLILS